MFFGCNIVSLHFYKFLNKKTNLTENVEMSSKTFIRPDLPYKRSPQGAHLMFCNRSWHLPGNPKLVDTLLAL